MKSGEVFVNNIKAGVIQRTDDGKYSFIYDDYFLVNKSLPAISLTLPKTQKEYTSRNLFPFFYGLLAEGINKEIQCSLLNIDEQDDFTRLLKTAGVDTIGAVTIKETH